MYRYSNVQMLIHSLLLFPFIYLFNPNSISLSVVRLSKLMGYNGEGRLEAWNSESNNWRPVCGEKWDVDSMSTKTCHNLGYEQTNKTWIQEWVQPSQYLEPQNRIGDSLQIPRHTALKILFDKEKTRCKQHGQGQTVFLKCNKFGMKINLNFLLLILAIFF